LDGKAGEKASKKAKKTEKSPKNLKKWSNMRKKFGKNREKIRYENYFCSSYDYGCIGAK